MTAKVRLTPAQRRVLRQLLRGTVYPDYRVFPTLVRMGLAVREPQEGGYSNYTITEAGRKALEEDMTWQ